MIENQIGLTYGKLTIISRYKIGRKYKCYCICECGNYSSVELNDLRCGHTKSCGCLRSERSKGIPMKYLLTYNAIIHRCNSKKSQSYKNYGGRGIKCEWNSVEEFYKDMGGSDNSLLEIDRIDNNGNYCKENCRWVTPKENCNNKRNTLYYKGEPLSLVCERLNLNRDSIQSRLHRGWNIVAAVEIPIKSQKGKKYKI